MKLKKAKHNFTISGGGILLLCSISLLSVGFSAWYSGVGSPTTIDSVNVAVGDVVLNSKGLKDFGFEVVAGSATSLTTSKRLSVDDESVTDTYLNSHCFSVKTTVDINVMSQADYCDDLYLSITFAYSGYTSKVSNIIDSLTIYPENYVGYSFNAVKSSKTIQTINGKSTLFSFPMKTKNDISVSSIALLDTTYPKKNEHVTGGIDYKVPLIFEFSIDEDTLNSDIANSSTKYSVTFSLSKEVVN